MKVQNGTEIVDSVYALLVDRYLNPVSIEGGSVSVVIKDANGTPAKVDDLGQLHIVGEGHLCDCNSTTDLLLAGQSWIGESQNILAYNGLAVFVTSDVSGVLEVQFSKDGLTNWRTSETYIISAGAEKWFTPPTFPPYFRLKYTNDGSDQTEFEIMTKLSKFPFKWSSHNIFSNLNDEDDAELVAAVLKLRTAQNQYVSGAATNNGNFKVSLEELESGISENSNTQLKTSPNTVDEYGIFNHVLGDNIFRGAPISIPTEHHEIHCGDSYTAHNVADLGNGATLDYIIIVPNWGAVDGSNPGANQAIKLAHWLLQISGESETDVLFYESPTVTANGTALAVRNRNRNSNNTDFLEIYQGATVSAVGTELEHERFGSGKLVGGLLNRADEWVLKNNTTYLVRVINLTTSLNYHALKFQYYVHPGV